MSADDAQPGDLARRMLSRAWKIVGQNILMLVLFSAAYFGAVAGLITFVIGPNRALWPIPVLIEVVVYGFGLAALMTVAGVSEKPLGFWQALRSLALAPRLAQLRLMGGLGAAATLAYVSGPASVAEGASPEAALARSEDLVSPKLAVIGALRVLLLGVNMGGFFVMSAAFWGGASLVAHLPPDLAGKANLAVWLLLALALVIWMALNLAAPAAAYAELTTPGKVSP